MKGLPVTIMKERDRTVAVEVGEENYAIPEELEPLLVALGCNPSERENPLTTSITAAVLDADRKQRQD